MFKKILLFIRTLLIIGIWSWFSFICLRNIYLFVWSFDILMWDFWQIVIDFWNKGGTFKTPKDVLFLIFSLSILPLWIYILIKLIRTDYAKLINNLFEMRNANLIKNHFKTRERFTIRNLSNKKNFKTLDEIIEDRIKEEEKIDKEKNNNKLEADNIRENMNKKLKKEKETSKK